MARSQYQKSMMRELYKMVIKVGCHVLQKHVTLVLIIYTYIWPIHYVMGDRMTTIQRLWQH